MILDYELTFGGTSGLELWVVWFWVACGSFQFSFTFVFVINSQVSSAEDFFSYKFHGLVFPDYSANLN